MIRVLLDPFGLNMPGGVEAERVKEKRDHVPHPSNHQNVLQTERFRHILTMVLDHAQESKSAILRRIRSLDPFS